MSSKLIVGLFAFLSLFAITATQPASASLVFSFVESGGNVIGTLSGTLNLAGMSAIGSGTNNPNGIIPDLAIISSWAGSFDAYAVVGPTSFGTGSSYAYINATSQTGSTFILEGAFGEAMLPSSYTGGALSATLTFDGATFASLGITPDTYVYTLPNDTITVQFSPTPLPATLPLFASGLGLLGLLGWRRKKKAAALAA